MTPDAKSKTHFVLIDAVDVCERMKTDDPPLDKKRSVPFGKLLDAVALGKTDDDTVASLASRLGRLAGRLTPDETQEITDAAGGMTPRELAQTLLNAIDPDARLAEARAATGQEEPDKAAQRAAAQRLMQDAVAPFDNPDLREALQRAQRRDEQVIDTVSADAVTFSGWDPQAEDQARLMTQRFTDYLRDHQDEDEITALQALYSRPRRAQLRLSDLRRLAQDIKQPPLGLTTDMLWQAYARLDGARVRGASGKHILTDLVALVRYAMTREIDTASALRPYGDEVKARYAAWLAEQEAARGAPFTPEQRQWLDLICEQVATSLTIERDDFDYDPFIQRGGYGKAYQVFGQDLTKILADLIEQHFTRLDAGVAALRRAQTTLKRYRASVLKAAVEGRLTAAWRAAHPNAEPAQSARLRVFASNNQEPIQDRRHLWGAGHVSDIPDHLRVTLPPKWELCKVRDLGPDPTNVVQVGPMSMKSSEFTFDGVPVLNVGCVQWGRFELSKLNYLPPTAAAKFNRYRIQTGDIVFTRSGTVGRCAIATDVQNTWLMTFHLLRVRSEQQICLSPYLTYVFEGAPHVRDQIKSASIGSTRAGFNTRLLEELDIPLPPLAEQEQIVAEVERRLSVIAELEQSVTANLKRAERLRQSVLREAFAGRLVAQDAADEPASALLERIRRERAEREGQQPSQGSQRPRTSRRQRSQLTQRRHGRPSCGKMG